MKDTDLYYSLNATILGAPLVIKNFVVNEVKCNYELYLRELINNSQWIKNIHKEEFKPPETESNGEYDVTSGDYGVDFKLIASKTQLQAQSLFQPSANKLMEGVVAYGSPKENGQINATRIFAALRNQSLDYLYTIREGNVKKQGIENDILTFLKTLETKKNLLLFFPYVLSFSIDENVDAGRLTITKALQNDFGQALIYRRIKRPEYETFFVTIYNEDFLIFNVIDDLLVLVDIVPTNKCETFKSLKQNYDTWR